LKPHDDGARKGGKLEFHNIPFIDSL
jgi:hypothetical protein